jgi:hypothetical protein
MDITVLNNGPYPLRVVIDSENINDQTLEPDEEAIFNTRDQGTIEFRELGADEAARLPQG